MLSSDTVQDEVTKLSSPDEYNAEVARLSIAPGSAMSPPPDPPHPSEPSSASLLLHAIQDDNLEMVQRLIDQGVGVENSVKDGKMAPMIAACMVGRLEIAKYLFARGARITDVYCGKWISPLHMACDHNHVEVVQWLVENGADVNDACTESGVTPVAVAAMHGHLRIVKYLISCGATTTRPISTRDVSLQHLCAEQGNLVMLKYLVENEIGRCYQQGGETSLNDVIKAAVRDGHVETLKYLLLREDPDARVITACLPVAIESKQTELVGLLIKYGADVNAADIEGKTPLYYAVHSGLVEVFSILLTHGADVHQCVSESGHSAIHEMAQCGQLGMLDAVAQIKGPEVNFSIPSERGRELPLHLAAAAGRTAAVRFLLQRLPVDFPINVLGGWSRFDPLMYASQKGHLDVVQMLVEHGAIVDFQEGSSPPLILASEEGHFEVVKYLCKNGANVDLTRDDGDTSVITAARYGNLDVVEYLLEERHADFNARTNLQTTALSEAVMRGFGDITRLLLSHNALAMDIERDQPDVLCQAVIYNQMEMVELLLQFGVNVNARCPMYVGHHDMELTPLTLAAGCGHLKLVKYLCENGADAEVTTEQGESPLYFAAFSGDLDVVKYLVEEQNANLDSANNFKNTPVEVARCAAAHDIEQYLLGKGAAPPKEENCLDFGFYELLLSLPLEIVGMLTLEDQESAEFFARRYAFGVLVREDHFEVLGT